MVKLKRSRHVVRTRLWRRDEAARAAQRPSACGCKASDTLCTARTDDSHGEGVEAEVVHHAPRGQKQLPLGERPGLLAKLWPQRSDRTVRRSAGDGLPTLALPSLVGSAVDETALHYLLQRALVEKEEAEEKRKRKKEAEAKRREHEAMREVAKM